MHTYSAQTKKKIHQNIKVCIPEETEITNRQTQLPDQQAEIGTDRNTLQNVMETLARALGKT